LRADRAGHSRRAPDAPREDREPPLATPTRRQIVLAIASAGRAPSRSSRSLSRRKCARIASSLFGAALFEVGERAVAGGEPAHDFRNRHVEQEGVVGAPVREPLCRNESDADSRNSSSVRQERQINTTGLQAGSII
jgi:hypothetical protein